MKSQTIILSVLTVLLMLACKKDAPIEPEQEDNTLISDTLISGGTPASFQRIIGGDLLDAFYSVRQDANNDYYLCGFTENDSASHRDVLLLKTNEVGEILWFKRYFENFEDQGWHHELTSDNGIIMVLTSSNGADIGTSTSDYFGRLIKTDTAGLELWRYQFTFGNYTAASKVLETSDGGYVVCGSELENPSGFILKTDNMGAELWRKSFSSFTEFNNIKETSDGGFIICGTTKSSSNADLDVYIVRTNSIGDTLWTKTYGDSLDNRANSILESSSNFTFCGSNSNPGVTSYVMQVNAYGDSLWYYEYTSSNVVSLNDMKITSDNNLIAAGSQNLGSSSGVSIIKIDNLGIEIWNKQFNPSTHSAIWDIQVSSDNGFVLAGTSNGSGLIIKTDTNGN